MSAGFTPVFTVNSTTVLRESASEPDWYGRPVVEVLSDGTAVMIYYRAEAHATNAGALHISFSDDYGATWTVEDVDLDGNPVTGFPMNPPDALPDEDANEGFIFTAPDGNLIIHSMCHDWNVSGKGPYQSISTDGGKTWPALSQITIINYPSETGIVFSTNDYFVYDGVMYVGVAELSTALPNGDYRNALIKSPDSGAAWEFVSYMSALTQTSEVGIEYLDDGLIIAVLRTQSQETTFRNWSSDTGLTWSGIENITTMIPASGRHRIWTKKHLHGEANWWDDDNLLMCGFVFVDGQRRSALWMSKNRGVTWSAPLYVDIAYADGGYGDVFYNPVTGHYIYVNYRGDNNAADLVQYDISINW